MDSLGDLRLELRHEVDHPVDGVDDVGSGLSEDDQEDGRLPVAASCLADVLHRVGDAGDIGDADRRSVPVRDDDRLVLPGLEELVGCAQGPGLAVPRDLALGMVGSWRCVRALRTSSRPSPKLFSSVGLTSTRTAGSGPPPTETWPTPFTWESFWARMEEAASYIRATL